MLSSFETVDQVHVLILDKRRFSAKTNDTLRTLRKSIGFIISEQLVMQKGVKMLEYQAEAILSGRVQIDNAAI